MDSRGTRQPHQPCPFKKLSTHPIGSGHAREITNLVERFGREITNLVECASKTSETLSSPKTREHEKKSAESNGF